MNAPVAFAMASMLHAGFQVTVTLLVYPALASRTSEEWVPAHRRHSRTIAPLVGVVYGALLVAGVALVVGGPDPAGWVALGGAGGAMAVTAAFAAPLHGRLTERDQSLVTRLLVVDRWRCLAAVVGAVAAAFAMW